MSHESQFSLLGERRFGPFFLTQALGAFNNNVFKNALVIMLAFQATQLSADQVNLYVNLAAGLFILPFFLFSATAGQVAEKFDKAFLIRRIKLLEIAIMATAAVGFWLNSVPFLMTVLFLMGTQSALFGPVKYSILPQHLRDHELVGGNGLVEMGTFVAILLGTMLGGWLIAQSGGKAWAAGAVLMIALAGYAASRLIPGAPATAPDLRINWNPVTETWRNFQFMKTNRTVFLSVLGISWFWFYGATFLAQLPTYTKTYLGGDESVVTLMLTVFSLGVGAGSLLCERLSGRKVEMGLVPFGAIGLTLFGLDLFFAKSGLATATDLTWRQFLDIDGNGRVVFDLAMTGLFGGFYIVPLYALIQSRAAPSHRSRIIAGNNILNAIFMVVAAALAVALFAAGLTIPQLFLVAAVMNAAVAVYIYTLVPEFLMRFMVWLLIHSVYRLEKTGLERIPHEGAALLACNHVSFVDALVISAACPRPIRWVMYHRIFQTPLLSFFFRTARAIPVASAREDPAVLEAAYERIGEALSQGELVGIFPEGRLTTDGEMGVFRGGVNRILQRTPVTVVPMALSGLWASLFARQKGALKRAGSRLFPRIRLAVGQPIAPSAAAPDALRAVVLELRGD
ncbi:MAG TPA: MFS transporter, partial [Steroidobacteraceae bacterium]|nr:MFS transporter [Steroidobacteraceae bacterium]